MFGSGDGLGAPTGGGALAAAAGGWPAFLDGEGTCCLEDVYLRQFD